MSRKLFLAPCLAIGLAAALASPGVALAARELAPASSPATSAAAAAPSSAEPVYTFEGLLGLNQDQARGRLGAPDLAQAAGSGAMWTYRLNDCALFVFFRSDNGQPLTVSGAAAGQRRRGQSVPTLEACLAAALNAHAPPPTRGRSRP